MSEESDGVGDVSEESFGSLQAFIQEGSDDLTSAIDHSFESLRRGEVGLSQVGEEVFHFIAFVDTFDRRLGDGHVLQVVQDSLSDFLEDVDERGSFVGLHNQSIPARSESIQYSDALEIVDSADLVVQVHLPQDHLVLVVLLFIEEGLDHGSELYSCVIEFLFIIESESDCQIGEDVEPIILQSSQNLHPFFRVDHNVEHSFEKEERAIAHLATTVDESSSLVEGVSHHLDHHGPVQMGDLVII